MSVVGLGLDLVEIDRVRRLLDRFPERALARLLTDAERDYCLTQAVPARHVAARLAAKEAAYKAFQLASHFRAIGWRDSEVVRDSGGKPGLVFHGVAAEAARVLRVGTALLSLSHAESHAAAVVLLLGEVANPR